MLLFIIYVLGFFAMLMLHITDDLYGWFSIPYARFQEQPEERLKDDPDRGKVAFFMALVWPISMLVVFVYWLVMRFRLAFCNSSGFFNATYDGITKLAMKFLKR